MARIINRVGEVYNGLKIVEELGNNEVKAICLGHGHLNIYNKSALVSGSIKYCKTCKEDSDIKVGDIKGDYEVMGVSDDKVAVRCTKCGDRRVRVKKSFKYTDDPKCKLCSETSNFKSIKGETFGKLKVVRDRGGGVVIARCAECGAIGEYNKSRLTRQGYKCICCEKKNGGLTENKVGKVFNGSYVLDEFIGEDGKQYLKVECVDCRNIHNVLKGSVITFGHLCKKCYDKPKNGVCPKCKEPIIFKRVSRKCRCGKCGEVISRDIISSAVDFQYRLYKNAEKYGGDTTRVIGSMQILGYKYKGRDSLNYFDAVCLDHNKKIVANMNEAKTHNHELCDCEYEM